MKLQVKIALVTGALALAAGPAALAAGKPEGVPPSRPGAQGNGPHYTPAGPTPGPKAGLPEKAKAYGRYCKGESKQHVDGETGHRVQPLRDRDGQSGDPPEPAPGPCCKDESRKHVKGEKGTPFSRCVKAAAQLRHDREDGGV